MKDNFSLRSAEYAKYRPSYPDELFSFIKTIRSGSENAWDCGTGNGQIAVKLASHYTRVFATDISTAQLNNALQLTNIFYSVQPAEATVFEADFFDLVIVGQAVHWFDFQKFYNEVRRTAKNNAIIIITGYGLLRVSHVIDPFIDHLYHRIVGKYWDKERKYIDEGYQTIPFPFIEIETPQLHYAYNWSLHQLVGYLQTWSAVNHYIKENSKSPIDEIYEDLATNWGENETKTVTFPLLLRAGWIKSTS